MALQVLMDQGYTEERAHELLFLGQIILTVYNECTDTDITTLVKECPKTISLDLKHGQARLTNASFISIANYCPHLKEIHLYNSITDQDIIVLTSQCKELNFINLSYCVGITDESMIAIAQNCVELYWISLTGCTNITDRGINALADGCPDLEVVYLSECNKITDDGFIALSERCLGISIIAINHNLNISEEAIITFSENVCGLTYIGLYLCANLTEKCIVALEKNCVYLNNIDCHVISDLGERLVRKIKTRIPPSALPKKWWVDDELGPRCKGMMN